MSKDDADEKTGSEQRPEGMSEDGQYYIDRDKVDFDPDEGLLTGTAIEGGSEIPGPHETQEDIDDGSGLDPDSRDGTPGVNAGTGHDDDKPTDESAEKPSDDRPKPG